MKKKICIVLLTTVIMLVLSAVSVSADSLTHINIRVKYCQTYARSICDMVNEFRTGEDTWYWNPDNTTKSWNTNLNKVTYDYDLEKAAMKRAAECAIKYSHERPNGQRGFTAYSYQSCAGENIAAGHTTPAGVFLGWKEDDSYYSGQGHRRIMLSGEYNAIGIGCVYYNGTYYWAMEFRGNVVDTNQTEAEDGYVTESIETLESKITERKIVLESEGKEIESLEIAEGKIEKLPDATVYIKTDDSWPGRPCPILRTLNWQSSDENVVKIENGAIVGIESGNAEVTVSSPEDGIYKSITVKSIKQEEITSGMISSIPDQTYTGSAITPELTITDEGTALVKGTDYTVTYENNTYVGTAKAIITGIGSFDGTFTAEFKILPKNTSSMTVKAGKKHFRASWKKQRVQTTGYVVQYSQKKDFSAPKYKTIKSNKAASVTVKKLKSKMRYYVRIATYKNVGGEKYQSAWSKMKTVKIR